jgi:beta-phosphoglucomutase-like phosphatase (HAD superfamily)
MRALIFDCDGVLADTELHDHLVAFNRMWHKSAVPWRWSEEQYAEKLKIGGGKERMRALFDEAAFRAVYPVPASESGQKELLAQWHAQKTAIYQEIIASGGVPGRTGVKRLAEEALAAGWLLAVASTSAKPSVEAVLRFTVGDETAAHFKIFAGDIVPKKKPAPDIYLFALTEIGVPSSPPPQPRAHSFKHRPCLRHPESQCTAQIKCAVPWQQNHPGNERVSAKKML